MLTIEQVQEFIKHAVDSAMAGRIMEIRREMLGGIRCEVTDNTGAKLLGKFLGFALDERGEPNAVVSTGTGLYLSLYHPSRVTLVNAKGEKL